MCIMVVPCFQLVTFVLDQDLIVALSKCSILDLSIFAKVDAFVSAYLAALAKVSADICVHIGNG